ncbi:MAG TPA: glycoside hydrolase family 15 protein [Pyrinomonadaceae bacterium]|jgi:glucoamylase
MVRLFVIATMYLLSCTALLGQATNRLAPGAPGLDAHWPSAAKNGFGTANTLTSKVWFTLSNGVMTEVYYPRLDLPNSELLQLIVCTRLGCQTEQDDMRHEMRMPDPRALSFQQINAAKDHAYTITKTYTTDPQRATILIQVSLTVGRSRAEGIDGVYVFYDPSLNNSGMHDTGWSKGSSLLSSEGNIASALVSSNGLEQITNTFRGSSDGLQQLKRTRTISERYDRAENGNVVQLARIPEPGTFTLALGFGATGDEALVNARASLAKGFASALREYEAGWHAYLKPLRRVEPKYRQQFNVAAQTLKALEDKTFRGAIIASPSIPWGGGPNANEPTISGYHAVWSRDLYHVATAFLAMGDRAGANRALDYLFKVQQKADGSFPQNSWVDGRSIGGGLQMDQVALPLVLAYQLQRADRTTWLKHIKPAADFIVRKGPSTGQDRWEEKPGYSPATIAAEIAGLVCAAFIASTNGDKVTARNYLKVADEWTQNIERWTVTKGRHGEGQYYLRITANEDPDDGAKIEINSSRRVVDERAILDAGFLELVRLGIKDANDPLVAESLALIDQLIKVETPGGSGWYRYNHDAYGETPDGGNYDGLTGVGRLWTLLTGERGEYDVANQDLVAARKRLDAMIAFANDGWMIPEQVWDRNESPYPEFRFGKGTGSATPLAWSMAQFIRLAINLKQGHNVETPIVVAERYLKGSANN